MIQKTLTVLICTAVFLFSADIQAEKGKQSAKEKTHKTSKERVFGAEPSMTSVKPISIDQALQKENLGKTIRMTAYVIKVCQKKGCWMIVQSAKNSARVTFRDYAFFVPKNCMGKKVIVEGIMNETIVSEADARHYAEDDGMSKKDVEKIKGEQKEYSFVATSVIIP